MQKKIKYKIIKLRRKYRKNLHELGLGKDLLDMTPKALSIEEK